MLQLEEALQVKPKLSRCAEEVGKSQRCVAGDGALAVQDLGYTIGRNLQSPRQFRGAHSQFFQFFGQVLARMDCAHCHSISPMLMVIDNFDVGRTRCPAWPFEADSPLLENKGLFGEYAINIRNLTISRASLYHSTNAMKMTHAIPALAQTVSRTRAFLSILPIAIIGIITIAP